MTLTLQHICRMLGVSRRCVSLWIRNGQLKGCHAGPKTTWHVEHEDFVDFLRKNPLQMRYFKEGLQPESDVMSFMRDKIFESVKDTPRMYTIRDLSEAFGCDLHSVYNWMNRGYLSSSAKDSFGRNIFTLDDAIELLKKKPKYRKNFTEYNRKEAMNSVS